MILATQTQRKQDPVGYPDFTLPVSIIAQIIEKLKVDIVAQTLAELKIDIVSQTLAQLNVNIAASAITLDVNIASSAITLDVNIAASAVTLNVNIVAQTVDLNIKTSGGANIIIDKLTQTAYTDRRVLLSNNGVTPIMFTAAATRRHGKFFPRGCRGFIRQIEIYCDNPDTADHVVTVYITPHPNMGALYSVALTVAAGATAAWRALTFRTFWGYDSLFIYAKRTDADYPRLAYDTGTPFDGYYSDNGVTWIELNERYWFRVDSYALTVGDVPVSGTINTIAIPNVFSEFKRKLTGVLDSGESEDLIEKTEGAGALTAFMVTYWQAVGTVEPTYMAIGIDVDGKVNEVRLSMLIEPLNSQENTISPISFGTIDTANNRYAFAINVPIRFRRYVRIYAKNYAAAGNQIQADASYIIEKVQ